MMNEEGGDDGTVKDLGFQVKNEIYMEKLDGILLAILWCERRDIMSIFGFPLFDAYLFLPIARRLIACILIGNNCWNTDRHFYANSLEFGTCRGIY